MAVREKQRSSRRYVYLAVLAALFLFVWSSGQSPSVDVVQGSTLLVQVRGNYVEAASPTLLGRLLGDDGKPFVSLLSLFALAERDDRIDTVVIQLGSTGIGWGKATELRNAIGRLRDAGRETVVIMNGGSFSANRAYYIASAAEKIYAVPGSVLPVVGLAAQYLYFGNTWEKFGIGVEATKVGRYKGAVDMIIGTEMSEPLREMSNALLDSAEQRFASAVEASRGINREELAKIIDAGPVTASQLLEHGLLDGISHVRHLDVMQRDVIHGKDYRNVDPVSIGFDPKAQFALIYGSGNVVTGSAGRSTSGGPIFAADKVSDALFAASKNPEIDGIILRIDSPGGSPDASEYVWQTIMDVRETGMPVVVSVSDVAASAAYYIASAADAIIISPGALTGSIGVFSVRPNFEGLMEKLDVRVETLSRGAHADFASTLKPMSDGAHERMDTIVREIYELFITRVATGRNLEVAQVDTVGEGRVWSAEQALDVGLVDELGGLKEAVEWLLLKNGLDKDTDASLVSYPAALSVTAEFAELLQGGTLLMSRAPMDAALDSLPLPNALVTLRSWVTDLDFNGPLLVPSALIEIQ
jgi:protease-4